jgi:PTH1 family peptidyl-tRNA hydrolase
VNAYGRIVARLYPSAFFRVDRRFYLYAAGRPSMKLVVGLGNPGKKYARTRHNAGFWWVERLAHAERVEFRSDGKFHGHVAKLSHPAEIWLLMPGTFMNNSGRAVAALATFYKIEPREILVVNDELDLAPGIARLKFGGGASGHNGLKDVAECLGSRDFWRLRIGIGHPRDTATEQEVVDYVLHPPRAEEQPLIDDAVQRGLAVWPLIALDQHEAAMLQLHTKEKKMQ